MIRFELVRSTYAELSSILSHFSFICLLSFRFFKCSLKFNHLKLLPGVVFGFSKEMSNFNQMRFLERFFLLLDKSNAAAHCESDFEAIGSTGRNMNDLK